jgi:hypothetical protein
MIKLRANAKLWAHRGSAWYRLKAGPSQKRSHATPNRKMPVPVVIHGPGSNFMEGKSSHESIPINPQNFQ